MAATAMLEKFQVAISPQRLTIYLYSAHRAVIFAIAQLSFFQLDTVGTNGDLVIVLCFFVFITKHDVHSVQSAGRPTTAQCDLVSIAP